MKKVVLTGGTGFVGANLARAMLTCGNETHLLVRPGFKDWRIRSVLSEFQIHEVDLSDQAELEKLLRRIQPDWIFHLAAYGAYESQNDASLAMRANIGGTTALLLAAADVGFEGFVHAGSSSEYGIKDHPPTEVEALQPNSYYAVMKAGATLFCSYVGSLRRMNVSTLRLYSVYGPYEEPTRFIPTVIRYGRNGSFPRLASPDTARDFIYVDDVVSAFERAAASSQSLEGRVYNIGTGKQTTLEEVIEIARDVFGISAEPVWDTMAARKWDTAIWVSDPGRALVDLGWRASTTFATGFKETLGWLRRSDEMSKYYAANHDVPT